MARLSVEELILATAISLVSYTVTNYLLLGKVFAYYAFITSMIYFFGLVMGLYLANYILNALGMRSC